MKHNIKNKILNLSLGLAAATTPVIALTSCNKNNVTLDKSVSDLGITIRSSDIKKGEKSTIDLVLPNGKEIYKITIKIGDTTINESDVVIVGGWIQIPADKMTSDKVTISSIVLWTMTKSQMIGSLQRVTTPNSWNHTLVMNLEENGNEAGSMKYTCAKNGFSIQENVAEPTSINYYKQHDNKWFEIRYTTATQEAELGFQFGANPTAANGYDPLEPIVLIKELINFVNEDKITYDSTNDRYNYTYNEDVNGWLKFNSDCRLETMYIDAKNMSNAQEKCTLNFSNYDTVSEITFPFDESKLTFPDDESLTYVDEETGYQTTTTSIKGYGCQITLDSRLTNITTLSILDSQQRIMESDKLTDAKICLNGIELSYSFTPVEGKSQMILPQLQLEAGDSIRIIWNGTDLIDCSETLPYYVRVS